MKANLFTSVRKNGSTAIVDIQGEVNALAESILMDSFTQASSKEVNSIILNFTNLEYMNSSGIGLLVTLLIRANRQKQRLLAYGLSQHYLQIFELTRLNEAISIYNSEEEALGAAANKQEAAPLRSS